MQETLRLHPILPIIQRAAECDDTIPLAEPTYTTDGVLINAIPVEKGQLVHVAVHCYNRYVHMLLTCYTFSLMCLYC